jgi:ribosomal protein L37AE/L43A
MAQAQKKVKCESCGELAIGQIQGLGYCGDTECIDKVVGKALTPMKKFSEMLKP